MAGPGIDRCLSNSDASYDVSWWVCIVMPKVPLRVNEKSCRPSVAGDQPIVSRLLLVAHASIEQGGICVFSSLAVNHSLVSIESSVQDAKHCTLVHFAWMLGLQLFGFSELKPAKS